MLEMNEDYNDDNENLHFSEPSKLRNHLSGTSRTQSLEDSSHDRQGSDLGASDVTAADSLDSENHPSAENIESVGLSDQEHLQKTRDAWKAMLPGDPQDGDASYLVPSLYLQRVLESEHASSIASLVSIVGKLDCSSIVDEQGVLPAEDAETDAFTQISPELFHQLASTFGLRGDPVIRNIVINDDGSVALERNPPFFVVHSLNESPRQGKYHSTRDRSHQQYKCSFSLSQSKTFHHLVDAIKTCMFKAKEIDIRVWFVTSRNVEDLPPSIPVSMFISDIDEKKLIGNSIMNSTLRNQGITSSKFHLVAESVNRTTRRFPIDLAVDQESASMGASEMLSSGGNLGLTNLGNTCYMNSALQCLVHIPEVNSYFFFDLYERELNKSNPLGNGGEVAMAFSNLLHKLFDSPSSSSSHVTPREFKYTVGRYSSMFHGYQQQDSQEFLSWLLDALHEDLNRIYDKPYLEKPELKDEDIGNPAAIFELANACWAQHKKRNDSIISNLFSGLYQSTLICPSCSKQSVTFDPFNDLTLPLPVDKKWYHVLTVVDLSENSDRPVSEFEVELTKTSTLDELLSYLSDFLQVPTQHLFIFEVFRNYFYKNFQDNASTNKFLPVSELIGQDDNIIVYVIPHDASKDIIIPIVNVVRDEDKSYNVCEPFGVPVFVVLDEKSEARSFGTIRKKVEQSVKILSKSDIEERFEELKGNSNKKYFSTTDFPLLKNDSSRENSIMADRSADSDEYDSDVSLANPNVSASSGFQMRLYEWGTESHVTSRYLNKEANVSRPKGVRLKIPRGRPQFNNLPPLAEKLNGIKRDYYHYPDYVEQIHAAKKLKKAQDSKVSGWKPSLESDAESSPLSETDKLDFVIVNKEAVVPESEESDKIPMHEAIPSILGDDDIESDTNYDNVNPLFASVENFGGPPQTMPQTNTSIYTDSDLRETLSSRLLHSHPAFVSETSMLINEWDPLVFKQFFRNASQQAWLSPPSIPNPRLEENKRALAKQQSSKISLYDCLRKFSTPEVLGNQDLWYCPRCKDHKRATKTIQLWSTGDILTIHLKRFQSARHFSDKIDMVVDFPIEGLNMSEYVSSSSLGEEPLIYDLIAVDEHYGGLGGGHYTACAKNFRDGRWYKFNDSRVSAIEDPNDCITGAAYLLFYKKRSDFSFAGGDKVVTLLEDGQNRFEARMSDLGEHQRHILEEINNFNKQEQADANGDVSIHPDVISADTKPSTAEETNEHDACETGNEDEEDLYADTDSNESMHASSIGGSNTNKKSRSPMTEQLMKFEFENQRKQRLISKSLDSPQSVSISMGYSSSVSNLASPTGSTDEDVI